MTDTPLVKPHFTTHRDRLEGECTVEFLKGSGPGGQHRNKRDTGVRLVHPPSGVTVMATERRSQAQNLNLAFERLIRVLQARNHVPRPRHKTRPTLASVGRRLDAKRVHARTKAQRTQPKDED